MTTSNQTTSSIALLFCLNILFSSLAAASMYPTPPPSSYGLHPTPPPSSYGLHPTPPPSSYGTPSGCGGPIVGNGAPSPTPSGATCPLTLSSLNACVNVFNGGLIKLQVGSQPVAPCCTLIQGLVDLEANLCLCVALKASVLNAINLNVSIALRLMLNACGRNPPTLPCS